MLSKFISSKLVIKKINISPVDLRYDFLRKGVIINYMNKRADKVLKYKEDMEKGVWKNLEYLDICKIPTNPIIFLSDGTVWEGKHRMIALSKIENYNISYDFLSILGWPKTSKSQKGIVHLKEYVDFIKKSVYECKKNNWSETKLVICGNLKKEIEKFS